MTLSNQEADEEESEKGVVTFDNPGIKAELSFANSNDGEHDGQHTESDS